MRKAILEEELATEASHFVEAYAELGASRRAKASLERVGEVTERVDRHRRNIAALTRELARGEADLPPNKPAAKAAPNEWLIPPHSTTRRPEWLVPAERQGQ